MSDAATETAATEPKAAPATAVAIRPAREVRVVEDAAPLFDTARFEHYGRIAAVMATATLIPDAIRGQSREEAVGNCFMIVSMADRLGGFDPWAVAQDCSVIHGHLMLGGKLVSAAIRRKTGIDLHTHYVGTKGSDDFGVYLCDEPFTDEMIAQLEPGKGLRGYRVIDGTVGEWKTFEKDGKTVKGNWVKQPDIQLFYRGTRVWARRFEPAIMLGVYTEDEMENLEQRALPRAKRDLASRLTPATETPQNAGDGPQGFDRAGVAEALGDPAHGAPAASGGGEEIVDAEIVDIDPAVAQRVQAARDAGETVELGHAEPGVAYLLAGDAFIKDRRLTYKDGSRFSTVGPQGAAKLKVFATHAPEVVEEEEATIAERQAAAGIDLVDESETDLSVACEACGAPAGEPCADDCEGEEERTDATAISSGEERVDPAQAEAEFAEVPDAGFLAKLRPLTTWAEIKAELIEMMKTSDWKSASATDQDEVRRHVWAEVERVRADHDDKVDHATDVSAFGLWLATLGNTRDDADAIEGTFATLANQEVWGKLSAATQDVLRGRVAAKMKSIRGAT